MTAATLTTQRMFASDSRRQFFRFCIVGTSGYAVNLTIYTLLVGASVPLHLAAAASVAISVSNNYLLHRAWTFRSQRGSFGLQGARFLTVSLAGLAMNESWLTMFVALGMHRVLAEACASLLVVPASFLGNKLWAFRDAKLRRAGLRKAAELA